MSTQQPNPLELAALLDATHFSENAHPAAEALRCLYEINKELLTTLNKMRNAYIGTCVEAQADAMRTARAVIAKATGETK